MIESLTLKNWGPFRGRHVVRFRPGATAIVARHEEDGRRSNAVGKSILLEAVKYALTGETNKSRGWDVDGWISRGEKEGSVCLALEGGVTILRSKKVGQSRQLRFSRPGYNDASQDGAADAIAKYLAFAKEDYERVSYFEQKEAARMLRADPSDRLAIVVGWLGLGLADRAEERAGEIAASRWRDVEQLETERAALKNALATHLPADGASEAELKEEVDGLRAIVVEREKQIDDARELRGSRRIVAEHENLVAEGKKVRAWVDENAERIESALALAEAEEIALADKLGEARRALEQTEEVARGEFDGRCPVAGIDCPATETINADRVRAQARRKKAKAAFDEVTKAYDAANEKARAARAEEKALDVKRATLENMREEAREVADVVKKAKAAVEAAGEAAEDEVDLGVRLAEAREHLAEAEATLRTHRRVIEIAGKTTEQLGKVAEEAEKATASHRVAHRAREVFRLARRRVAEKALGEIEADANEAIVAAGVDLRLGVRWEKEAKKLALECSACGGPFPTSAKVKECARCGEARGMHTTPRLDFVMSDSSGGYDDLAGVALQLSAGAWLLAKRQSPWSVALLDEPTSAMDPAVRRGLVRYLAGVSARGVFRQLVIVSHSSDFVDALPNRIEIVRDARGERRIVS